MYLSSAWFGTRFCRFQMSGGRIGLVFFVLELDWVVDVCGGSNNIYLEVSRGSDRICYHDVSRGLDSFDILRCLELWIGFVMMRCLDLELIS